MFSREEASRIKEEFWTAFGRYMSPVLSSEGMKVNWVNYHTRIKDVYFRMDAGPKSAAISISIEHRDAEIQELYFEQFLSLKNILHENLGEDWKWLVQDEDEHGKQVSRIYKKIEDVNILNKQDWPTLISFFKPRIIALDSFWDTCKYAFESLH